MKKFRKNEQGLLICEECNKFYHIVTIYIKTAPQAKPMTNHISSLLGSHDFFSILFIILCASSRIQTRDRRSEVADVIHYTIEAFLPNSFNHEYGFLVLI